MQCHECGRAIQAGDRFCTGCGISLAGVAEPTEAVPAVTPTDPVEADQPTTDQVPATDQMPTTDQMPATELVEQVESDGWDADDPVWALTGPVPSVADQIPADRTPGDPTRSTPIVTSELPETEPVTEVRMEPVTPDPDPWSDVPMATATAQMPTAAAVATPGVAMPGPDHRFRFTAVTLLGVLGGIVLLVAMFASVVEISASRPLTIGDDSPAGFGLGAWIADDLADNLSVAGLIAALVMVVGGVGSSFGWRWGSGLAGGGGLAAAGLAAVTVGLAQFPIDAAHEFAAIPTDEPFTLTITKTLGYWLLIVAGAIGIIVFFASTNDAFSDHRGGLNPWIAALGALAIVVATAGPLLPVDLGAFDDNWYVGERAGDPPAMLVAMRLVQLGLFAIGGVVGFLSVRRWGLGVAAGATLPAVWLGVSTLFEIGDSPIGLGFRNPGAADATLHGVTIIGLSATLAMLVLAAVAAYDQSTRR